MFSYLQSNDENKSNLKIDPHSGLFEFPPPGETKKFSFPLLIDSEDGDKNTNDDDIEGDSNLKGYDVHHKDYWMPDKLCKVCYSCEEAFTMYRRRHHCRMCGQVFCNPCSSHYIDISSPTVIGPVRSCRLCYEQLGGRFESKLNSRRKRHQPESINTINKNKTYLDMSDFKESSPNSDIYNDMKGEGITKYKKLNLYEPPSTTFDESPQIKTEHVTNLQNRASTHLDDVIEYIVKKTSEIPKPEKTMWHEIIAGLAREVVSNVDPDVRGGDSMDIRPYVKLKIIPGGRPEECSYIGGVVFRKNISHRCMLTNKVRPRILLLGGGIDFERLDFPRLSSLDTLLEQENRYLEILVEKIMSLRPDVIFVGKSVARRAQELLSGHPVAVVQNVKLSLLERLSRMTGATMLVSTDHMIQQYGEECLGSCDMFYLKYILDDPERSEHIIKARRKTVRAPMFPGSTYVFLEGCPSELGCSIVLRGADRPQLKAIKTIMKFAVMLAYHLRLEVAYYTDRYAMLPMNSDDIPLTTCDSDDEDWYFKNTNKSEDNYPNNNNNINNNSNNNINNNSSNTGPRRQTDDFPAELYDRNRRLLLSSSLDVDIGIPCASELRGMRLSNRTKHTRFSPLDHQTLLVTSLLLMEPNSGSTITSNVRSQRARAEVKGIRFYTMHDVTLGQFLTDSCFHFNGRRDTLLDHMLCFVHRTGRIDISVTEDEAISPVVEVSSSSDDKQNVLHTLPRLTGAAIDNKGVVGGLTRSMQPTHLSTPAIAITMSSFCKICKRFVTPEVQISEETWKMSFGKFMELTLYCRSAICRNVTCGHNVRDDLILKFHCDGYCTTVAFTPIHSSALHVRSTMPFPYTFHGEKTISFMRDLLPLCKDIIEKFSKVIVELEKEAIESLSSISPEVLSIILNQIAGLQSELFQTATSLADDVVEVEECLRNGQHLQRSYVHRAATAVLLDSKDVNIFPNYQIDGVGSISLSPTVKTPTMPILTLTPMESFSSSQQQDVALRFPMAYKRELFLRVCSWNELLQSLHRRIEEELGLGQGLGLAAVAVAAAADAYSAVMSVGRDDWQTSTELLTGVSNVSATAQSEHNTSRSITPVAEEDKDNESSPKTATVSSGAGWASVDSCDSPMVQEPSNVSQKDYGAGPGSDAGIGPGPLSPMSTTISSEGGGSFSLKVDRGMSMDSFAQLQSSSNTSPATLTASSFSLPTFSHPLPQPPAAATSVHDDKTPTPRPTFGIDTYDKKKGSRLTKALARLLGKDSTESRFTVPLGHLGTGRLGLKPGCNGRVLPIFDDELATIIAYSLSSEEYRQKVKEVSDDPEDSDENSEDEDTLSHGGHVTDSALDRKEPLVPVSEGGEGVCLTPVDDIKGAVEDTYQFESGLNDNDNDMMLEAHSSSDNNQQQQSDSSNNNRGIQSAFPQTSGDIELETIVHTKSHTKSPSHNKVKSHRRPSFITAANATATPSATTASIPVYNNINNNNNIDKIIENVENCYKKLYDDDSVNNINNDNINTSNNSNDNNNVVVTTSDERSVSVPVAVSVSVPLTRNKLPEEVNNPNNMSMSMSIDDNKKLHHPLSLSLSPSMSPSLPPRHPFASTSTSTSTMDPKTQPNNHPLQRIPQTDSTFNINTSSGTVAFLGDDDDDEGYVRSLSMSSRWNAQGGKSGATFSKSHDGRLVMKQISKTELQMFLDFAPAYFEYMAKAYYHRLPSLLCKILGVYQIGFHNKVTGKKVIEQVVVMENLFYERTISLVFDLKGSSNRRNVPIAHDTVLDFDEALLKRRQERKKVQIQNQQMKIQMSIPASTATTSSDDNTTGLHFEANTDPSTSTSTTISTHTSTPTAIPIPSSSPSPILDMSISNSTSMSMDMGRKTMIENMQTMASTSTSTGRDGKSLLVLLDENLMALTHGLPFPLRHKAKVFFQKAVLNDTLFLSIINVVDYSIIVGFDDVNHEIVVGIIDYMRQYDMIKRMESMGKSVGMMVGKEEPTVIPPLHYRKRFQSAMEKYFMTVPDKWVAHEV
eukprot:gene2649-5200_t